jgi:hypothetical protein
LQSISDHHENRQSLNRTLVDSYQNGPIGTKGEGSDIFAILERKGKGIVTMERTRELNAGASVHRTVTDLTKSNTDTLLPTGLSTELPSGVNMMFPC